MEENYQQSHSIVNVFELSSNGEIPFNMHKDTIHEVTGKS